MRHLKEVLDENGKQLLVIPVGIALSLDGVQLANNGSTNVDVLSLQITNQSVAARQLPDSIEVVSLLPAAKHKVSVSDDGGGKTAISEPSEAAKLVARNMDQAVLKVAVCDQFVDIFNGQPLVMRARDCPGLPAGLRNNDNLYIVLGIYFSYMMGDLVGMHQLGGFVQWSPYHHERLSDYSNLDTQLLPRNAFAVDALYAKLDAARKVANDTSQSQLVRATARQEAKDAEEKLYTSGLHAEAGRERCAFAVHLPKNAVAGSAWVDRDKLGYFGLFLYGSMHVHDLGVFLLLVKWVLAYIDKQTLTTAQLNRGGDGRARRSLLGERLSKSPGHTDGVRSVTRRWKEGVTQKKFSASDVRSLIKQLPVGISGDSMIIADPTQRELILKALDHADKIQELQRREKLHLSDVDELRRLYREFAKTLSLTEFVNYRPSKLNFPKWRFALLMWDSCEGHGRLLGMNEEACEKSFKVVKLVYVRNTSHHPDKMDKQIVSRLSERWFCSTVLPQLLTGKAPAPHEALIDTKRSTFGMRGQGKAGKLGDDWLEQITFDALAPRFTACLEQMGVLPANFQFDTSLFTPFKGCFITRLNPDPPLVSMDTSFYAAVFHGRLRRDVIGVIVTEDVTIGGTTTSRLVLSSDPRRATLMRVQGFFHYNDGRLFDKKIVKLMTAQDDDAGEQGGDDAGELDGDAALGAAPDEALGAAVGAGLGAGPGATQGEAQGDNNEDAAPYAMGDEAAGNATVEDAADGNGESDSDESLDEETKVARRKVRTRVRDLNGGGCFAIVSYFTNAALYGDLQKSKGLDETRWAPRREKPISSSPLSFGIIPVGQIGRKVHDRPWFDHKLGAATEDDEYVGASADDAVARLISFDS